MDQREVGYGLGTSRLLDKAKILIIDDHPLSCKGFELILIKAMEEHRLPVFSIDKAYSLKEAHQFLIVKGLHFDIVFLDIHMEAFPEVQLFSGEDLGKRIVDLYQNTKLIVMTSIVDKHRIDGILNTLNPKGFLIKTEIDETTLIEAVQHILKEVPHYSPSILRLIRSQCFAKIKLGLEEKEFLHLLSIGVLSKDIPNYLPWSASKVEKQKRALKEKLAVGNGSVLALVYRAKELGFI